MKAFLVAAFFSCLILVTAEEYSTARLEVKAFINGHAPLYENFEVKYIGGADPELVFVKPDNTEERIDVAEMETDQICKTLEERGFPKEKSEEVPEPPVVTDEDGERGSEEL